MVTSRGASSGDFDGVDIFFTGSEVPDEISVTGQLGGYVKVGNALDGNPHKAQPEFSLLVTGEESAEAGGRQIEIKGGAELFVSVETILDVELPRKVEGEFILPAAEGGPASRAVYFVGREFSGGKVITSPIFVEYDL